MPSSKHSMLREPVTAYIGMGANLGDPVSRLLWAKEAIAAWPAVQVLASSGLYRSAPVDSSGPDYINAALAVQSQHSAHDMLHMLMDLECRAGRTRPFRHAPRTLDLDLLLYGSAQIQSAWLTVPHPRIHTRAFVLRPLHDIAPQLVSEQALSAVRDQRIELIGPL